MDVDHLHGGTSASYAAKDKNAGDADPRQKRKLERPNGVNWNQKQPRVYDKVGNGQNKHLKR